jgi:hypothetical protein
VHAVLVQDGAGGPVAPRGFSEPRSQNFRLRNASIVPFPLTGSCADMNEWYPSVWRYITFAKISDGLIKSKRDGVSVDMPS